MRISSAKCQTVTFQYTRIQTNCSYKMQGSIRIPRLKQTGSEDLFDPGVNFWMTRAPALVEGSGLPNLVSWFWKKRHKNLQLMQNNLSRGKKKANS